MDTMWTVAVIMISRAGRLPECQFYILSTNQNTPPPLLPTLPTLHEHLHVPGILPGPFPV